MCSSSSNDNSKLKKYFFFISFYSVTTNNNSLELYSIITWSGCFKFRLQKTCCGAVAPLVRFFLCVCFALFVCLGVVVTKNQRALFFPSLWSSFWKACAFLKAVPVLGLSLPFDAVVVVDGFPQKTTSIHDTNLPTLLLPHITMHSSLQCSLSFSLSLSVWEVKHSFPFTLLYSSL